LSQETTDRETEAEELNALVGARAVELAAATLGKSFTLAGARFQLYAKNRNTIYRVGKRFDWFLKLSPPVDSSVMPREQLGSDYCNRVLGGTAGYAGPFVTRVSLTPPYILAAALSGAPLTRALLLDAWAPWPAARQQAVFHTLGTLLSVLHADRTLPCDAPEATKRPFDVVRTLAQRLVSTRDRTVLEIAEWSEASRGGNEPDSFIHGNLRLDNLLWTPRGIGFVDFEACGKGPRYQDASRPITQLMLLRASIAAPTRRIDRLLTAFMSSYGTAQPYDAASLGDWVAVRVARYYLESFGRKRPGFIGGLPVLRPRLGALTSRLLRDGLQPS
jgi:hypothetical protein